MSVPETYLLCAPNTADDPFGRAMPSTEFVRKLRTVNPLIRSNEEYAPGIWTKGQTLGLTCLWVGEPGGASTKIAGITSGVMPEWTQLDDKGLVIRKGWREILRKVLKMRLARGSDLERVFKTDLGIEGKDKYCFRCRVANKPVLATSASGMCDMHERVRLNVWKAEQQKDELNYLRRKHSCPSLASPAKRTKVVSQMEAR